MIFSTFDELRVEPQEILSLYDVADFFPVNAIGDRLERREAQFISEIFGDFGIERQHI